MPLLQLRTHARTWLRAIGGAIALTASLALIGRFCAVPVLTHWLPGKSQMVVASALGALGVGLGLIAQAAGFRRVVGVLSGLTIVTVLWHVSGPWHSRVLPQLHLGFLDRIDPRYGDFPMSTNSAIALLVVGVVLLLHACNRCRRGIGSAAAGIVGALALLPLLQYAAWVLVFGPFGLYQGMSIPTSFCLVLSALALLLIDDDPDESGLPLMAAALGMLFSIGLLSTNAMRDLLMANEAVTRSYEIRTQVGRFVEEVARAESSSRAFALTGEKYFSLRVPDHENEALHLIDSLMQSEGQDPVQRDRLNRLRSLAVEKFAQNEAMLNAREKSQGPAEAAAYLRALMAEPGQPTSNLVLLAQTIRDENNQILETQSLNEFEVERNTRTAQFVGSVFALLLIGTALYQTHRAGLARRAAEQQFRTAFEDAGIGMALVGLDGRWLRVNRTLLQIVGYSEEQLLQLNFQAITHPDDLASDLSQVENLLAGRTLTYQLNKRYRCADGRFVWGHLTVSMVRDAAGQPLHFISQIEDITARKLLEEEIITARDDALAAARSKSEFLATMSHEIRTPMNGILGSMELLQESTLDGEQRELVELVRTSAEALMRVLNDILDFSKIEQGKLSVTPMLCDLRLLVQETAELFTAQAEHKGLTLTVELAPALRGDFWIDSDRLRQVLNNLLSNALKFTETGTITVQVTAIPGRADIDLGFWFRFSVRDTGIGIPTDAHSRLFQSFTQVDGSTSRRFGGTGLGLAISKRLVELLGGQIGLESSVGEGTEVWFELPLPRPPL